MAEPTPKPWIASKSEAPEFYIDEWDVDQADTDTSVGMVAIVNGEANARRMAAAPEMLEALEWALPRLLRRRSRLPGGRAS